MFWFLCILKHLLLVKCLLLSVYFPPSVSLPLFVILCEWLVTFKLPSLWLLALLSILLCLATYILPWWNWFFFLMLTKGEKADVDTADKNAQTQGEYHTSCQKFAIIKKGEFVSKVLTLNKFWMIANCVIIDQLLACASFCMIQLCFYLILLSHVYT